MFNRILLPLDGSTLAERAIPHAEQFARIFGASVLLLQVLEPGSSQENIKVLDPLGWQIRKTEADLYMQAVASRIRKNLGENVLNGTDGKKSRVHYAIREGKTAENIVDFAHAENVDLLIISTHGSSGLSRWNINSVTQKVINSVYLHVLLVRAYNQPRSNKGNLQYHRILLPIDNSRRAEFALPAGIALARRNSIRKIEDGENSISDISVKKPSLILVDIIKPPEISMPGPYPQNINQLSEQLMQVTRKAVSDYINELKDRLPIECETRIVENEGVSSVIHELACKEDIDLVVLSAHGYNGQFIGPYGTITRNYIEHGTKPVLVLQDMPRSQVQPGAAQIAAEKSGRR